MANVYRELFRAPGTVAFSAAGFVARMTMPMTGIGIITMLGLLRGDYALAGAVSAAFTLSTALCGPRISRWVDRAGQHRVLWPAAGLSLLALGALLLCARYEAPVWSLFVCAVLAGALPNMAAMVRARWTHLHQGSPRLHTAYAWESVVDELTFVIGPALAVALSTVLFPEAGPLAAAVLLALGVAWFVPQKATEPPVVRAGTHALAGAGRSAVRNPSVRLLASVLVAGGAIVGTVDVVSVAFAEERGTPAGAGIVLSAYAVGSALAGLAFGARTPRLPLPLLLVIGAAGTACTTLPLLWVDGLPGLAALVFVSGLFFAPTMIVVMGLVERSVPAPQLTEGMTWAITGLSVGVALGAAVSGHLVDRFGPASGFVVAVVAGALALLLSLAARGPLTRTPAGGPEPVAAGAPTADGRG
ncbi:MFS transporter [Streptomyces sp. NPDC059578]|uniref:MFS transporter n=1 Tax=Streptomyces sp. NPDC059578 TaxID=3346874 RepID=UPI0036AA924A